uniref:Uncharacterized protein n=1 Tax=Oryza brachyantha TaxID=4533 RepID=J3KX28_ORYBR
RRRHAAAQAVHHPPHEGWAKGEGAPETRGLNTKGSLDMDPLQYHMSLAATFRTVTLSLTYIVLFYYRYTCQ